MPAVCFHFILLFELDCKPQFTHTIASLPHILAICCTLLDAQRLRNYYAKNAPLFGNINFMQHWTTGEKKKKQFCDDTELSLIICFNSVESVDWIVCQLLPLLLCVSALFFGGKWTISEVKMSERKKISPSTKHSRRQLVRTHSQK